MLPVLAIVGRPNVGKSTLFNRLVGFNKSVVHDRPGVTRDRVYEEAEVLDRNVMVIDTGGIEPRPDTDLLTGMRRQTLVAIEEADVIVFVVDAQAGFTPPDAEVADLLRRAAKKVILAVNKVDGPKQEDHAAEFWQIGIDPLLTISAVHGRGIYELYEAIVERLPPSVETDTDAGLSLDDTLGPRADDALDPDPADEEEVKYSPVDAIRVAVVGRPNIGKSTLINYLLGEDRMLVHDAPGTTMDPVDTAIEVDGQKYVFVDTAGVRKKAKIEDDLERWVSLRSIRAIERCHVTLLVLDGTEGPTDQDARLAQLIVERGRAVIVLVNKWDLVKDMEQWGSEEFEDELGQKFPHLSWAKHLFISAKTGKGIHRVLPTIDETFRAFDQRIGTGKLNQFLERALHAHTPPQRYHHPVRLYYMVQNRVRPPTFTFFSNSPEGIGQAYQRYLGNRLREEFGFWGTPMKLRFRARRKIGEAKEPS